jgi:hypothetical protein
MTIRPSHCSDRGLADLVAAFAGLEPQTNELKRSIAGLLGFAFGPGELRDSGKLLPDTDIASTLSVSGALSTAEDIENPDDSEDDALSSFAPGLVDRRLTLAQLAEASATDEGASTTKLPPLEPTDVERHLRPLRQVPLLHEQWFAGVMFTLLATAEPSAEVDVRTIEQQVVRGRPLVELPLRRRLALQRGVQVLLDYSESMQPFWRDETCLLEQLRCWLGPSRVHAWSFDFDARRPVEFSFQWHPPRPTVLRPGTPLLLVSNVGQGRDDGSDALLESETVLDVVNAARRLGCPLVALVPLPEPWWPSRLRSLVDHIVEWDRATSPQIARRLRRGPSR